MGWKRLRIPRFKGLDTRRGAFGADAAYAADAVNFVCEDGVMKTAGGTAEYAPPLPAAGESLFEAFFRDVQTMEEKRVLIASGGGCVYALSDGAWKRIAEGCASDRWRFVNYRNGEKETVLMVNGTDGMLSWDGVSERAEKITATQGGQEIFFEHLTLLYERLWGAVHASAPDRIYWSESFAPEDWEVNYDAPDAGGGFLDVATFDGSRIRSIVAAFDDVLIFKDKSMHRLNGTYPGEFSLTQVYGAEGTIAPRSIVHTADRLYFLGTDGLCVYNGMSVSTLEHAGEKKLKGIWDRMNRSAIGKACAVIWGDVLYLALALDGAAENSHVLEYRLNEKCASLVELSGVKEWLIVREDAGEKLVCLTGNRIVEYGRGALLNGAKVKAHWVSPEIALGTLTVKCTVGRICMAVEASEEDVQMKLALMSGQRIRERKVRLVKGLNLIRQRLRIRGRSFRFRIENVDGCALKFPDGMEIVLEEDSDL